MLWGGKGFILMSKGHIETLLHMRDLVDTIEACLVAAGAPNPDVVGVNEMERVVSEAGTKPSHFIKQEVKKKEGKIKRLNDLIWLMQREIKEYIYELKSKGEYIDPENVFDFTTNMDYFISHSFGEIIKKDFRKEVEKIQEKGWSKREAEEAVRDEEEYYEFFKRGEKDG